MPVTLVLGNLREEDYKFKDSLGYIARPCTNIILTIAIKEIIRLVCDPC